MLVTVTHTSCPTDLVSLTSYLGDINFVYIVFVVYIVYIVFRKMKFICWA
jgi:hypothetical protein